MTRGLLFISLLAVCVNGCATRSFSMRTLPDETPAADNARAIQQAQALQATRPAATAPPVTRADAPPLDTYDPWERPNRFVYRFNARFDENLFLPVADEYRRIPLPVRTGVHNFFGNLAEVPTVVNDALQGQLRSGARSAGRFLINSTLGIGGLFDFASRFHLVKAPATFGSTLSAWGVHPGAFLVIPLLGPSTVREGLGYLGDYGISYGINIADLYRGTQAYALGVVDAVDTRANTNFRYYQTGSAFEYENIRFLYMRKILIEDEKRHPQGHERNPDATAPAGR